MKNLLSDPPLWSTLQTPDNEHVTNTHAGRHFKFMRIEGEKSLKVVRFVDKSYEHSQIVLKQLALPPPIDHFHARIIKKSSKRVNEPDDLESSEMWSRGKRQIEKPKGTYEYKNNLKKLAICSSQRVLQFNKNLAISNPAYYYDEKPARIYSIACTVNFHDPLERLMIMSEDYICLFREKSNNSWLGNYMIDFRANIEMKKKTKNTLAYIPCEKSKYILVENQGLCSTFYEQMKQLWFKKTGLLLPCLINGNHWVLVYANLEESSIYLLNPGRSEKSKMNSRERDLIKKFINFYKTVRSR